MTDKTSVPQKPGSVVSRKIKDEYILVPLSSNIADMDSLYRLNETGAFIWEAIDGHKSITEIAAELAEEFDVETDKAERDVIDFINTLDNYLNRDKR